MTDFNYEARKERERLVKILDLATSVFIQNPQMDFDYIFKQAEDFHNRAVDYINDNVDMGD
jgi:hypothetical protein